MRLNSYSMLRLIVIILGSCLASAGNAQDQDYDKSSLELSQIRTIFPDAELVPCKYIVELSVGDCRKNTLYIGYLTWKVYSSIRFTDLDFEINSGAERWKAFLPFAEPLATDRSPSIIDVASRRDKFLASDVLATCLRAACGRILKFKRRTPEEVASFWDKSSKFILCMEHRDRKADPTVFDVGPAYFYRLAALGKIKSCSPLQYPNGLAEIIQHINPQRSY